MGTPKQTRDGFLGLGEDYEVVCLGLRVIAPYGNEGITLAFSGSNPYKRGVKWNGLKVSRPPTRWRIRYF